MLFQVVVVLIVLLCDTSLLLAVIVIGGNQVMMIPHGINQVTFHGTLIGIGTGGYLFLQSAHMLGKPTQIGQTQVRICTGVGSTSLTDAR